MFKEKWKELNWLSRVAYILVAITLLSLPISIIIIIKKSQVDYCTDPQKLDQKV